MVKVKAYAKVNFFLKITGIDGEGYHLLDTVMASVSLCDEITVSRREDDKISLSCPAVEGENTALAAARLFKETFGTEGFDIRIDKGIPIAAGLGGSSADIAGTLYALGRLFGAGEEKLAELAARCGSDAPFMLKGGFARATGRGGNVQPFDCQKTYYMAIAKPEGGVLSGKAYKLYDEMKSGGMMAQNPTDGEEVARALNEGDLNALSRVCVNDLYLPAKRLVPQIAEVKEKLRAFEPACLFMSGSGSALAAVFESEESARLCAEKLKREGIFARFATTVSRGVEEIY